MQFLSRENKKDFNLIIIIIIKIIIILYRINNKVKI